jgi:hypothetical protein
MFISVLLPRAAGAADRDHLACGDVQAHVIQGMDDLAA